MAVGDLDSYGLPDLVLDFGPGNGINDIVVDFGPDAGIWVFENGARWYQLTSSSADQIVTAHLQ